MNPKGQERRKKKKEKQRRNGTRHAYGSGPRELKQDCVNDKGGGIVVGGKSM